MVAALALLLSALPEDMVDFPWTCPQSIDSVVATPIIAVVTAETNGAHETRQELDPAALGSGVTSPGSSAWCRTGAVRAISGKGIRVGEELRIISTEMFRSGNLPLSSTPPTERMPLQAGRRYLLFGFRPDHGRLSFYAAPTPGEPLKYRRIFPANSSNEVAAVMMFPTSEGSIPASPDPDTLRLSVARTIDPAETDTYRRATAFLHYLGPSRSKRTIEHYASEQFEYTAPSATTRALEAVLPRSSLFQQSKIWHLLLEWKVLGSSASYIRLLEQLSDDPSVYQRDSFMGDGSELQNFPGFDFEPDRRPIINPQEYVDLVTSSKNEAITEFFLRTFRPPLKKAQVETLARGLLDPSVYVRRAVAYRLAQFNDDPIHMPSTWGSSDDDVLVNYWLEFYKLI